MNDFEFKLIIMVAGFLVLMLIVGCLSIYQMKKMLEASHLRRSKRITEIFKQHEEIINQIITDHLTLSNKDYNQLLDSLKDPPEPNQKLVDLMKEKEDNK